MEYFHGSMDDIRFHSRALSAGEIRQLYILEKPVAPPPPINEFTGNSHKLANGSAQEQGFRLQTRNLHCAHTVAWLVQPVHLHPKWMQRVRDRD